jgi:hypothetical protein
MPRRNVMEIKTKISQYIQDEKQDDKNKDIKIYKIMLYFFFQILYFFIVIFKKKKKIIPFTTCN